MPAECEKDGNVAKEKTLVGVATAVAGAALLLGLMSVPAMARPDTRTMTCQYAQGFVRQNKAVIMSTGPYTYERFVANSVGYCGPQEQTRLLTAPTLDNPRCRVGYICETSKFD
jgi:hypothetical protein